MKSNLPRRTFLRLAAGVAALPAASRITRADSYPSRPLTLVVGFPPRGGIDITARLIGQALSDRLGQPLAVENRTGAGTNVAIGMVVRAQADGYTLLLSSAANAINASLVANKMDFNFIRDIAPVASVSRGAFVIVVNPLFPAKSVPEFIAYAKANPGKITMGSSGTGTVSHIAGELFKAMAGIDMVHSPYRGEPPALTDLISGQIQVHFGTLAGTIELIRAGKLRALAVTTAARSEMLPDVPTVGEFLPGYEASLWNGVGAPRATPMDIIDKLNKEINAGLTDPQIKAQFRNLGSVATPLTPAEYGKVIVAETEKWGKVIRAAKITLE